MREDTAIFTAYDDFEGFNMSEPERNLMYSILRTAIDDLHRRGDAYRDARAYLLSGDTSHLFSFRSICLHLNLCPNKILKKIGLTSDQSICSTS